MAFDGNGNLQGGDGFTVTNGIMNITNGVISGVLGNVFMGSVSLGCSGLLHASINSGGNIQPFTFMLNAAQNAMAEVDS